MRETVIKHYLNGGSERQIASKMRILRSSINFIITKHKKTKCMGKILGRGRELKASANVDQIIQRKIKADRRKSAPSVKVELQSEHGIIISEHTVCRRLHEVGLLVVLFQEKPYINKINRGKRIAFVKTYPENLLASGITSCGQMKANLTYLAQMGKLWFGECQRKSSIQNVLFQLRSMLGEMSSVGIVSQPLVSALWFSSMEI